MIRTVRRAKFFGTLGLLLAGVACGDNEMEPVAAAPVAEKPAGPVSKLEEEAMAPVESLSLQVAIAVTDLAERAGVPEDGITVKEARLVNWASSAVGCPREGMNYMQVIVPGVLLLLETGGTVYRYHGEVKGEAFYCPDDRAEAPAFGQGEEFM